MAKAYNSKDQLVYFAGNIIQQGLRSVTATPDSPVAVATRSIDGTTTFSKINGVNYTVTIVVDASSDANDVLSALLNSQNRGTALTGIGVFSYRDTQGNSKLVSNAAMITNAPDFTVEEEVSTRTWTIVASDAEYTYAGTPDSSA